MLARKFYMKHLIGGFELLSPVGACALSYVLPQTSYSRNVTRQTADCLGGKCGPLRRAPAFIGRVGLPERALSRSETNLSSLGLTLTTFNAYPYHHSRNRTRKQMAAYARFATQTKDVVSFSSTFTLRPPSTIFFTNILTYKANQF